MKITLRRKVLSLIACSVLLTTLVVTSVAAFMTMKRGEERAVAYKQTLLAERKAQVKGYVEMAVKLIENLSLEDARKAILLMRYGNNGYIYLQDYNNFMLAHPDPALDQTDQTNLKDPNGVFIIQEMNRIVREAGEGYLSYFWKNSGQQDLLPKLSFGKAIPAKKWIVVSGHFINDIDEAAAAEQARIKQEVVRTILVELALAAVSMILMMAVAGYIVNRFIAGPVESISRIMKGFDNDLTKKVPVLTSDEVGELAAWINQLIASLNQNMRMVGQVTSALHAHAGTISGTISQQTSFAAELSSSVAEMTSTMEELSASAGQIAQHSQGVVERADKTLLDTRHGADEVENLTVKINNINHEMQVNLSEIVELGRKSKDINKIMEIINNIANQTKLIAFNAALEASSAGEAGKRFGVVAVEIRRLADSVVESTAEIEGKITEILDAVNRLVMSSEKTSVMMQSGQDTASQTSAMLMSMVEGVEEATDSARQISLSTQQQQIASSQVLLAIREIDQGVRQSTDTSRSSSKVAEELADLSDKLQAMVSTFKTGDGNTPGTPAGGKGGS